MPQVKANGLDFYYETFGPETGEPMLLIMGLGAQMTRWPPDLIKTLAGAGYRVIAFDNRDVGLSSKIDAAGAPDMAAIAKALGEGRPAPVAYTIPDMAADAVGVLDALGVKRAHIVGVSLGGMIGQTLAADYPDRVLSLTSIMSTSGNPNLPRGKIEATGRLGAPAPNPHEDLEAYLAHSVTSAKAIGGTYPIDEATVRAQWLGDFHRSYYPVGTQRQMAAAMGSPPLLPKLKTIKAPTVVVHGDADPLVPVEGGRDSAANIPGAELRIVVGAGHDMPVPVLGEFAAGILAAAARARASA